MKTIVFTAAAAKQLVARPARARAAIETAFDRYAVDGHGDVKRLQGRDGFRMRVGEYRVIFNDSMTTILAIQVGRRQTTTYSWEALMVQVITTPKGEELVLLSRAEYESLTALAAAAQEDAADVAAYDAAMAEIEAGRDGPLPAEVSALLLRGASLVTALRKWRGMKQSEIAERAGLSQGYLSDLESGRRKGAPESLEAVAKALEVPASWLI